MTHPTQTNKFLNFKRDAKTFILILLIICSGVIRAQPYNPMNTQYNYIYNTAVSASCPSVTSGGATINTVMPGTNDPNWMANTICAPGGPYAKVMFPPNSYCAGSYPFSGAINPTVFPFCGWITVPTASCGFVGSGSYSCAPGGTVQDVYFNRAINVPTNNPTPYMLRMSINASDWVQAIWINHVNSGATYTVWNSNSTSTVATSAAPRNVAIELSTCTFSSGLNYVIVHVKRMGSMPTACKYIGMAALCWAVPNYTTFTTGPSTLCAGATSLYAVPNATAMGFGPPMSTTYTWTKPPTWGGSSTTATLSATAGTNSGIIIGTLNQNTSNGKYCLATGGYSVTVPPPITIMQSNTMACAGGSVSMLAMGATNYTWYNNITGNVIATNTAALIAGPLSVPGASLKVKGVTTSGCVYTKTIGINVYMNPIVNANSGTTVLCQGQGSVGLWASGTVGNTYTWAPVSPPTSSTAPSILVQPTITTVYTLTGKNPNGCTATATKTITVNPTPSISAASPSAICSGNSTTLNATGGTSYTWSPPIPGTTGPGPIVVTPNATTIYTITGTNSFNCTKTATVQVLVNPSPTVVVTPPSVCPGVSNTFSATGALSYTWTIWPTGTSNFTTFSNVSSVIITPTVPMSYSVCGKSGNGCSRCISSTVPIGSPVPISVSDMTMCSSSSSCTPISVSTASTTSCIWQPSASISGSNNGQTVTICPTSFPSTYTVFATSTVTGNCPNQAVMSVYQETNCCTQPTAGLTVLNNTTGISGIYANNSYLANTSMTLTGDSYFRNSEVWITPGVQITVPSGTLLNLDHTHLFACSNVMWKGIKLMDGSLLTTPQATTSQHANSLIEDAEVAVDVDFSSFPVAAVMPTIAIEGVIFNKNNIGIRVANTTNTLTNSLGFGINGCIFTSRNMPYTTFGSTLSWPSSAMVSPGLKAASNFTGGLNAPYIFPGMPIVNTKAPYNTVPGFAGIQLKNLTGPTTLTNTGSFNGVAIININPGSSIYDDFVLFDGMSYGIDALEAGIWSKNLVFQNMDPNTGGDGVRQIINGPTRTCFMMFPGQGSGTFGMRTWDCVKGLNAQNVYDINVSYSLFRSTQTAGTALFPNWPGNYGIYVNTNRFYFNVTRCEFNNLKKGISFSTPATPQWYDMTGYGQTLGVYADLFYAWGNFFGAQVTSTTAYSGSGQANNTEYMETAIEMITPNPTGWTNVVGPGHSLGSINYNKIDRVFRGITIDGMLDFPFKIDENSLFIEDDYTFGGPGNPAPGWGISLSNSTDVKTISTNTLESRGNALSTTNTVSLIHCYNNLGTLSPNVHCNFTKNAHYGFQFEDNNSNAVWAGNHMCNEYAGLALISNGIIGQQGSGSLGSENFWEAGPPTPWCGNWQLGGGSTARYQTYADNSDASLSPLYVFPGPGATPIINFAINSGTAYNSPASILNSSAHDMSLIDCALSNTIMPNWRMNSFGTTNLNQENRSFDEEWISIYPNPTNGNLTVFYEGNETTCDLKIYDLQGRIVYSEKIQGGKEHNCQLNDLPASVYILEFNKENRTIRKKLIKTN